MTKPKVSIVIPTIPDRIEHLQRALSSIAKQTYNKKLIETIVVREGNSASEARNIGIERATGKYIAFLDDDDICHPERIELQVEAAEKHPEAGLIISWIEDKRFGQSYIDNYKEKISHEEVLKLMRLSSTSSYFVKTDIVKKLKGFDVDFPSAQEYELAIRISKETKNVICVQKILVTQNKTENQITSDWDKKIDGFKKLLKKHKNLYKNLGLTSYITIRIKFFGMIQLFKASKLTGGKIYKIIVPIKRWTGNE